MPTITINQLKTKLTDTSRAAIVTFVANTEPDMRKTDNPYLGCRKIARVNGIIKFTYESCVNRQRVRESQPLTLDGYVEHFTSLPRRWGVRVHGTPFVTHNGNTYLETKVSNWLEVQYRLGNHIIPEEDIGPFLKDSHESSRQGVDKKVILRDYNLVNIKQIAIGGGVFEIV
jgi:hypothetical protein